jgi:GTP cyclohydrolase II
MNLSPQASVRTTVPVPLRLPDGFATDADAVTFDGLVDGQEHLALGLGDWRARRDAGEPLLVRPHSEYAGLDTYAANRALGRAEDERDDTVAAQMLGALGVMRIDLLSNNPDKAAQLRRHGVEVVTQTPTAVHLTGANGRYLRAKVEHTAHTLALPAQRDERVA